MEYIRVTAENIEKEHICCAISNNNDIQVSSKKSWLKDRFEAVRQIISDIGRDAMASSKEYLDFILEQLSDENTYQYAILKKEWNK